MPELFLLRGTPLARARARLASWLAGAVILIAALGGPAAALPALPLAEALLPSAAGPLMHSARAGACRDDCADCEDCPVEIDIVPRYPGHGRIDPIAREIERIAPPAPPPHGVCPDRRFRRFVHRGDPLGREGCGIRCWYWRLRHGYCGPGCEYYYHRLNHFEGRVRSRVPHPYACPS